MSKKTVSVLLIILFLLCSNVTLAQQNDSPKGPANVIIIYYFKAKAGMAQQFEDALKVHLEWLVENKCPWPWNTWMIASGDRYGEYVITSAYHRWADFDEYEAFFQKQIKHFRQNASAFVESIECHIDEADFINARMPVPMDFDYIKLFELFKYDLKPEKTADFYEARSKIQKALVKANWPVYYYWEMLRTGGSLHSAFLIVFHKDWAGMEAPDKSMSQVLVEVYGVEEAKAILSKVYNSIDKVTTYVAKYLPHLSYNAGKIGWRRQM